MGHQETMATGSALRRILLVLAVAALMAAMMLASAMPAFAAGGAPNEKARAACDHPGWNNVWFC
jgi:hypothetical protein